MQVWNLKRFVLKNSWFAGEQKIVGLILPYQLLGGFKYVLIFTLTWGNDPIGWYNIFQMGGSTTN